MCFSLIYCSLKLYHNFDRCFFIFWVRVMEVCIVSLLCKSLSAYYNYNAVPRLGFYLHSHASWSLVPKGKKKGKEITCRYLHDHAHVWEISGLSRELGLTTRLNVQLLMWRMKVVWVVRARRDGDGLIEVKHKPFFLSELGKLGHWSRERKDRDWR